MLKSVNNFHICKHVNYGKVSKLSTATIKFIRHCRIYYITNSYPIYSTPITAKPLN